MIREKLLELMEHRQMSLPELAEKSGLSIDTVKNIIYGRTTDPKLSTIIPICDALNCSLDYILGRSEVALQQVRDYPEHSKQLLRTVINLEFHLQNESSKYGEQVRPVFYPASFANDHMNFDSCHLGYIDVSDFLKNYSGEITCGVLIEGNELSPIYYSGDCLMVDCSRHPKVGDIGIWHKDQILHVSKYILDERGNGLLTSIFRSGFFYPPISDRNYEFFGIIAGVYRGKVNFVEPGYHSDISTKLHR